METQNKQATEPASLDNMPIEKAFDILFPSGKFAKSTQWTGQGSTEGLNKIAGNTLTEMLDRKPKTGVILVKKLPDGGYEIKGYQSND